MDTDVPINKFGRERKISLIEKKIKSKKLKPTKYYISFDLKDDEEVFGITAGYVEEEELKKVVSNPSIQGKMMPFLIVNAILVWVPPKQFD